MSTPTAEVRIRPVTLEDAVDLAELVVRNRDFFRAGEPRRPDDYYTVAGQRRVVEAARRSREAGTAVTFVIESDGDLVGRISLNSIIRGAFQSASVGYAVDRAMTGRGVATTALRQVIAVAFDELGLHRLQGETTTQNAASQRVLLRCGFVHYGRAPHYLHIDGRWQTHDLYQLINDDHIVEQ